MAEGPGGEGDAEARDRAPTPDAEAMFGVLYDEMRDRARKWMRRQPPGHTLQATALVHEVFLRLAERGDLRVEGRAEFLALAARAMRSILVDHARKKGRRKRGDGAVRVPLDAQVHADGADGTGSVEVLDLDDALRRLAAMDPRAADVVEMKYFGGLTAALIGERLGITARQVEREWEAARAWLHRELS